MGITIKHLEGPLAGQEQYFDDTYDSIMFGRDPVVAQVVYPPEYNVVGRRHFQLRRTPAGDYTVELFGPRYVEINGQPADNGTPIKSGNLIRLGSRNGPSFKVEVEGEADEVLTRRLRAAIVPTGLSAELAATHYRTAPRQSEVLASVRARKDRGLVMTEQSEMVKATQRLNRLSWVAAVALGAAAAAVLAYLWFRREIVLGAALGNLFQAATPPPSAKSKDANSDLVDVSVFGPKSLPVGGDALVQVFLHQLDQRELANALAEETDPDATRRGVQTLAAEIERGQRVTVMLEGRGLAVDQEMQSLVWRGEPCSCQFTVTAPEGSTGSTFHPRVLVLVNSVPVGSIAFALKVAARTHRREIELRGDRARRYAYAFLSYASPDRAEVIKRAQGLKAGGTEFFNDLLSLEPGERWEQRLYQEIDRCDVFYLFWSSQAKASEWVMKEAEYALARRASSDQERPDIVPVIIEGPPPPTPPDMLKDIHFNDCLLYVLAATESVSAQGHTSI